MFCATSLDRGSDACGGSNVNVLSLCRMDGERQEAVDHMAKAALRMANMNAKNINFYLG